MTELKLTIELVPKPLWGRNLHNLISRSRWDILRKLVYEEYDYHCGVCGATGRLNCHEVFYYDEVNHIQYLTGLIALCDLCNSCKHMGRAGALSREGKVDIRVVVDHFCTINNLSWSEFRVVVAEAFNQWKERNKYEWTQDFGKYSVLIVMH